MDDQATPNFNLMVTSIWIPDVLIVWFEVKWTVDRILNLASPFDALIRSVWNAAKLIESDALKNIR